MTSRMGSGTIMNNELYNAFDGCRALLMDCLLGQSPEAMEYIRLQAAGIKLQFKISDSEFWQFYWDTIILDPVIKSQRNVFSQYQHWLMSRNLKALVYHMQPPTGWLSYGQNKLHEWQRSDRITEWIGSMA